MVDPVQDYVNSLDVCSHCGCVSECLQIGMRTAGWDAVKQAVHYLPVWACKDEVACNRRGRHESFRASSYGG